MRPGARSIRGAMGAYFAAGVLLLAVLGLALWCAGPRPVRGGLALADGSRWVSAALDDGQHLRTLHRGESVEAPPGRYRLTLVDADGYSELRSVDLADEVVTVGE